MKKTDDTVTLNFTSDLKYTDFSVLVMGYLKNLLQIDDDNFFKIEIALREVINNAIIHGNKGDPKKRVTVRFKWNKKSLSIVIIDENTEKVDFERINQSIAEQDILSPSGRGILIMKSYMDKVCFLPSENGTMIVMEKKL